MAVPVLPRSAFYEHTCCEGHSMRCEPPAELCCEGCAEARHPEHGRGLCVLAVADMIYVRTRDARAVESGRFVQAVLGAAAEDALLICWPCHTRECDRTRQATVDRCPCCMEHVEGMTPVRR